MKSAKRKAALVMAAVMVVSSLAGISMPETVSAASKNVVVSTQKQLNSALKNKKVTGITIKTSSKKTMKIASGTYSKKTLTVNAAKVTVNNKAKFKSVAVKNATTYNEFAKNNSIKVTDSKLNLVVKKGAVVKAVTLAKSGASDVITVDGTLKTLYVKAKSKVVLKGATKKAIAVKVSADGCRITSAVKVSLDTTKAADIVLEKNAVDSVVKSTVNGAEVTVVNNTSGAVEVVAADGSSSTLEAGQKTLVGSEDKKEDTPSTDGGNTSGGTTHYPIGSIGGGNQNPSQTPSDTPAVSGNPIGTVTVSSVAQMASYSCGIGTIHLNSSESGEIAIPEGDYSQINLVVNAPNATIRNERKFDSIRLVRIAANTWYEFARDNEFEVAVEGEVATIHLVVGNGGSVAGVQVSRPVTLNLEGAVVVPLTLLDGAVGSRVNTTAPVQMVNNATGVILTLNSLSASQQSNIQCADAAMIPQILAVDASAGIRVTAGEETTTRTPEQIYSEANKAVVSGNVYYIGTSDIEKVTGSCTVKVNKITDDTAVAAETTTTDGHFEIADLAFGTYVIEVTGNATVSDNELSLSYKGILVVGMTTVEVEDRTIVLGGSKLMPASVSGVVKSALTGENLAGITVKLYEGRNIISGTPVASVVSGEDGNYKFTDLKSGVYTVVVDASQAYNRFISNVVVPDGFAFTLPVVISDRTTGGNDYVRFVLTWKDGDGNRIYNEEEDEYYYEGATVPRDLDSHLFTPGGYHTWYGHKIEWIANTNKDDYATDAYARLDVDDITYLGPETTSVYNLESGVYHFYVHNFSNDAPLTTSGAIVQVYVNGVFTGACTIDGNTKGTDGRWWDVCTYDSLTNQITVIDEIINHEPTEWDRNNDYYDEDDEY